MSQMTVADDDGLLPRGKGDPDFHGYPGEEVNKGLLPDEIDYAVNEVVQSIERLKSVPTYGYELVLTQSAQTLYNIINKSRKPF